VSATHHVPLRGSKDDRMYVRTNEWVGANSIFGNCQGPLARPRHGLGKAPRGKAMHCQGGAGKALTRATVSCQRLCGHAKLRPPCEDVIYTPAVCAIVARSISLRVACPFFAPRANAGTHARVWRQPAVQSTFRLVEASFFALAPSVLASPRPAAPPPVLFLPT
jgi:hypothetical protein